MNLPAVFYIFWFFACCQEVPEAVFFCLPFFAVSFRCFCSFFGFACTIHYPRTIKRPPQTFGSGYLPVGRGSPTWGGGGPKSSVCLSKPRYGEQTCWRDLAGISWGCPKNLRNKMFCVQVLALDGRKRRVLKMDTRVSKHTF